MEDTLGPLDSVVEQFAKELVQERIANGPIDVRTMSFAEMEMLSHQVGRRVAQRWGHQLTSRQCALWSDDDGCPTCGRECKAVCHERTVHSIDGETKVVELKSFCPKCRRSFFPGASRDRPG